MSVVAPLTTQCNFRKDLASTCNDIYIFVKTSRRALAVAAVASNSSSSGSSSAVAVAAAIVRAREAVVVGGGVGVGLGVQRNSKWIRQCMQKQNTTSLAQ